MCAQTKEFLKQNPSKPCKQATTAVACAQTKELLKQKPSKPWKQATTAAACAQTKELRAGQYALDSRYVRARFLTPYFAQFVTHVEEGAEGAHPGGSTAVQA